jgi:predicted CopG family antitoxin
LTDDAYSRLLARKRPHESFSDVVNRITRKRSLLELTEIMDAEAAESVAEAIDKSRRERLLARKAQLERQ